MKNLFKKVSAILMAAIMVLSMCATVFAAIPSEGDTADAVVHNVEAGATVNAYQTRLQKQSMIQMERDFSVMRQLRE